MSQPSPTKSGSEVFIVDNSDERWKVRNYLHDWCGLSEAIDIATAYFEIGSLLALENEWQKVDRFRIMMGDEVFRRTKKAFEEGLDRIRRRLDASLEVEKEKNDFLVGVPAIVDAIRSGKINCRIYRKEKFHAKTYITHARQAVIGSFGLVGSNKGAGEDEHRDRFEFAGGKIEGIHLPQALVEILNGKNNLLSARLTDVSEACWNRGRELPSLALRRVFEKDGEAYHAWNGALLSYVKSHAQLQPPFASTDDLRDRIARAMDRRERLYAEMFFLQEEIDWFVYAAYSLLPLESSAVGLASIDVEPTPLQREQRPLYLLSEAAGDFEKAIALIPSDWSNERKALWTARLVAICDNEHIRRIEQPVYKRRWDEQWKVGNRWMCGPVAYAAEFVDAFSWWLSEKAEWYLEHKAKGGPLELGKWTAALWSDERICAAWPIAVDCLKHPEAHKAGSIETKSKIESSSTAFARFFRELLKNETVPEGIPYAVPWDKLEKNGKGKIPARVKSIRGKLNVPRERFHITSDGRYRWAGRFKHWTLRRDSAKARV